MSLPASPGDETGVPVCPRHPDRESYVRCQRCERPVCPDCQRPAAVGVQCVDCVREQSRGMRIARTPFGAPAGAQRPVVTQLLIGICVIAYVLQWTSGGRVTVEYSFVPALAAAEPWRFLTSAFLHSPSFVLHIAFNLYALWAVGPYLERLLGWWRYTALYLLSAVGGSVGYLLLASPSSDEGANWVVGAVGASGAIFGLFAALLVVNRRLGRETGGVVAIIAVNVVLGFVAPGIAWQAHLGGLVTGAGVAAVLALGRGRRPLLHVAGLVGLALLLVVAVLWKLATVPESLLVPAFG